MSATQEPVVWEAPMREPNRFAIALPALEVTLLEDRARVRRGGQTALAKGTHRLYVADVAPVLQDVSVRAWSENPGVRVVDARMRRAKRVVRTHSDRALREADAALDDMLRAFVRLAETRGNTEREYAEVMSLYNRVLAEVSDDIAWGQFVIDRFREQAVTLTARARLLAEQLAERYLEHREIARKVADAASERSRMDRPDAKTVAWIELDVVVENDGDVSLGLEYVVPNALWRPSHRAELMREEVLRFTTQAAVWQNTGEDWTDVQLVFSTARASLGVEPPLLVDDVLHAQRRNETTVLAMREVAVQSTGPGGGEAAEMTAELPGVDDGGDVRNLRAFAKCTIKSDGRPHFVKVLTFDAPAKVEFVCVPEVLSAVVLRCTQSNAGPDPILAGPVELVRDHGTVGTTETLFVAPGGVFELGFGPQDELRVQRRESQTSDKTDDVDKWRRRVTQRHVFLSNLSDAPRTVLLTERIPVSEIEHARVRVINEKTSPATKADANGFCKWTVSLGAFAQELVLLTWELATAPGVQGL